MPLFGKDPRRVGTNKDIDLTAIARANFPIHARISYRPVAQVRDDASNCHASQGNGSLINGPMKHLRRLFSAHETYMRAYPEPQPGSRLEKDLFEGVKFD
jgi:hypothetical protein